MIIKKTKYGKSKEVTILSFGNGTIKLCSAEGNNHNAILLKTSKRMPIGYIGKKYKNSNEFNPEVVIAFDNIESINAFIETVLEVKELFENKNNYGKLYI